MMLIKLLIEGLHNLANRLANQMHIARHSKIILCWLLQRIGNEMCEKTNCRILWYHFYIDADTSPIFQQTAVSLDLRFS